MLQKKAIILNITAIAITSVFLFPVYWILSNSLKTDAEIFQIPPTFFPKNPTLSSYIDQIVGDYSIFRGLSNSVLIAVSGTVISMFFAVPASYGLARFNIRGKRFLILAFLATQMLPVTLLLTPLFLTFRRLSILNTYLAPILANTTTVIPFVVIVLRVYFLGIPRELEESSRIDGCTSWGIFLRIMLPLARTGLITAGSLSFLFCWNDLIYSLTFLNSQKARPLTAGIYNFITKYGIQWNYIMAFSTLIVLPVLVIFIFLQKYIVSGLTAGAVKR